jgi:alpha-1,2-mannosyltransferase
MRRDCGASNEADANRKNPEHGQSSEFIKRARATSAKSSESQNAMSSRRKPTIPAPTPTRAPASLSPESSSSPVLVASSAAASAPAAAAHKQRHEPSAAASSPSTSSSSSPAARPSSRARVLPLWFCFGVILAARVASALLSPIADCDEVFNYWEPVHYLLFGSGLQTWEYSPAFALRSYLYLVLHAAPLRALYALLADAPALLSSVLLLPSASFAAHVNSVQAFGVPTKVLLFYALRIALGTAAAFAEARFVVAATRALHRTLGTCARHAGAFLLLFTAFGPGQFIAAAAMLPQSFVLVCLQFAFAAWLEASTAGEAEVAPSSSASLAGNALPAAAPSARVLSWPLGGYSSVIWWAVAAALVGCWPFVLIVVLPMALHTLLAFGWWRSVASGVLAVGVTLGASLAVDRHYYGRWTLAVFNLAEYNARSQHGPTLYGVEPASFYVKNLALNWNVVFALGAAGPVFAALLVACTPGKRAAALAFLRWVAGGLLWAGVMFAQPHKEERFLYPIYHLLILSAVYCICEFPALLCGQVATQPFGAVSVSNAGGRASSSSLVKWAGSLSRLALVLVFVALSVSRNIAMVVNYAAPLRVWRALAAEQTALTLRASATATAAAAASSFRVDAEVAAPRLVNSTTVCVGKEWYRFASSFFVPHEQLLFLRSGFTGQLPQPFAPVDAATGRSGTAVELPHFNDENREEASRYAPVEACDFIVDLDLVGQVEERFYNHPDFLLVHSEKFLDATRSPQLTRAFWIPYLSQQRNIFRPYQLFRRKSLDEL